MLWIFTWTTHICIYISYTSRLFIIVGLAWASMHCWFNVLSWHTNHVASFSGSPRARTKSGKERGEPGKIYRVRNVIGRENLHVGERTNTPTLYWQYSLLVQSRNLYGWQNGTWQHYVTLPGSTANGVWPRETSYKPWITAGFVTVCCSMSMVSKTSHSQSWAESLVFMSVIMALTWSELNYCTWFDGTACERPCPCLSWSAVAFSRSIVVELDSERSIMSTLSFSTCKFEMYVFVRSILIFGMWPYANRQTYTRVLQCSGSPQ